LDRSLPGLPHGWITGDDEFGRPAEFRAALRLRKERSVLDVPCNTTIRDLERRQRPPRKKAGVGRKREVPFRRADRWAGSQPGGLPGVKPCFRFMRGFPGSGASRGQGGFPGSSPVSGLRLAKASRGQAKASGGFAGSASGGFAGSSRLRGVKVGFAGSSPVSGLRLAGRRPRTGFACPLVSDFVFGFSLNSRAGRVPLIVCQGDRESSLRVPSIT
jgi:hypothetical protein